MTWIDLFFVSYMVAMNSMQALLVCLSSLEILHRQATRVPELDHAVLASISTPPITIIAPAYNEEANVEESVRACLQVDYPSLTLIVVNDGSRDGTLARLQARFDLVPIDLVVRSDLRTKRVRAIFQSQRDPRLLVVDKENGGKADALNVGLNVARTPLVCCVDADSVIDKHALLRMVEAFLYHDQHTVAVGGTIAPANGGTVRNGILEAAGLPRSWLARFQIVEYLRAFVLARVGLNRFQGNIIISGAFGLFLRETLIAVGGYRSDSVGEDAELIVRIHREMRDRKVPYSIIQISDPICYTEVPETLRVLGRQRDRWQRGLLDTLLRHWSMMFRPRYGPVGMIVMPAFFVFELLGPVVELAGYIWFFAHLASGRIDPTFAVLFFVVAFFWGFLLSVQALVLEALDKPGSRTFPQQLSLTLVAFLENFGYRQMTLWFRARGAVSFLLGHKAWGDMQRRGLGRDPKRPA